jgi:hypothetical protein
MTHEDTEMSQRTSSAISGASSGASVGGGYGAAIGGILGYLMGGESDNQDAVGRVAGSYRPMGSVGDAVKTWDTLNEEELQRARKLDDFSDWGE